MKTETGARMELQKDGSVFVHQRPPFKNDIYTLVFQSELKDITGLRLEVLADSRLPQGGPGWSENGNFVLSELTLQAAPAESPDKARAIVLRNAAENELVSANPTASAIPVIDRAGSASKVLARSMRRPT